MEEEHRLPFATLIRLDAHIAELIVDQGQELDVAMVTKLHNWWFDNLETPFSILVNRINSYSIAPDAQFILGSLPELKAIAVIVYSSNSKRVVDTLSDIPREFPWSMKCFSNRQLALEWVRKQ